MKIITLLIIQLAAVIAANITFLWAVIEFILYLVKDKAFNWWSVWGFIISIIVCLACVVAVYFAKAKAKANGDAAVYI